MFRKFTHAGPGKTPKHGRVRPVGGGALILSDNKERGPIPESTKYTTDTKNLQDTTLYTSSFCRTKTQLCVFDDSRQRIL